MKFEFKELYDAKQGAFSQKEATTIITPTGKSLFSNKKYLDKIFKESDYISTGAVRVVYKLVGDEQEKLAPISFGGVIAANDSDNFIYLRTAKAYNTLSALMDLIKAQNGFFVYGDSEDLTSFSMMVRSESRDVIIEFNLVSEKVWVYQGKLHDDAIIHPAILSYGEDLGADDTYQKVSDLIVLDENIKDNPPPRFADDITVAELRNLLSDCGIIKYVRKDRSWIPASGFDADSTVINWVNTISSIKYKSSFTTRFGSSMELIEKMDALYEQRVQMSKTLEENVTDTDAPLNIPAFIWNYAKWTELE